MAWVKGGISGVAVGLFVQMLGLKLVAGSTIDKAAGGPWRL